MDPWLKRHFPRTNILENNSPMFGMNIYIYYKATSWSHGILRVKDHVESFESFGSYKNRERWSRKFPKKLMIYHYSRNIAGSVWEENNDIDNFNKSRHMSW